MNPISVRRSSRASSKAVKAEVPTQAGTRWTRDPETGNFPRTGRRGAPQVFPKKLFEIMQVEDADSIRWNDDGTAFEIVDMETFQSKTLLQHFRHQKYSSFQRQLNLYGFRKVSKGPDCGAYAHEFFLRDSPELLERVRRLPHGLANPKLRAVAQKSGNKLTIETCDSPSPSSTRHGSPSSRTSSPASTISGSDDTSFSPEGGVVTVAGSKNLFNTVPETQPSFRDSTSEDAIAENQDIYKAPSIEAPLLKSSSCAWEMFDSDGNFEAGFELGERSPNLEPDPPVTQQPFGSDCTDDLSQEVGRMVLDRTSGQPIPLAAPKHIAVAEIAPLGEGIEEDDSKALLGSKSQLGSLHPPAQFCPLLGIIPKIDSASLSYSSPTSFGHIEPLDTEKPDALATEKDRLPSAIVFAEFMNDDATKGLSSPVNHFPVGQEFGRAPTLATRLDSLGTDLGLEPTLPSRLNSEAWFGQLKDFDIQIPSGDSLQSVFLSYSPPRRSEMER